MADRRFSNDSERLCGRLASELQFITIEEVFDVGLHEYLDQIQLKLNHIGEALFNAYIFQSFDLASEVQFVQQEEQQQQGKQIKKEKCKIKSAATSIGPIFNF